MVGILDNLWGRIGQNPVEEEKILTVKPEQLQETFKENKLRRMRKYALLNF